ncbi:hypothetical protein [Burkholderia sp. 22PA0106]|uniref:hypothetical protein n=1 Tax=Burkholderia sp. 22PA0106 TaxID=3237371 RepID=UPI0039C0DD9D
MKKFFPHLDKLAYVFMGFLISGCVETGSAKNNSIGVENKNHLLSADLLPALRNVFDHGDLADVEFYQNSLRSELISQNIKISPFAFNDCAISIPPEPSVATRRMFFLNISPMLDSSRTSKQPCIADFIESISDDKVQTAAAKLSLNLNSICLSGEDVRKFFPFVKGYGPATSWRYLEAVGEKGDIKIKFILSPRVPACVSEIYLTQTYKEKSGQN